MPLPAPGMLRTASIVVEWYIDQQKGGTAAGMGMGVPRRAGMW